MGKTEYIDTSKLSFDFNNPRLVEFEEINEKTDDKTIIRILWEAMDVKELVLSIAKNGFFPNDPLICAEEKGKLVVIEGNRRLAAVRILLEPDNFGYEVPNINDDEKKRLNKLPVIRETREEAWKYIGFKHVNGPAKWGSYAKAKYIASVHNEQSIPLDDIALMIGDTHKTVRKLYRGLMVVQQAEKLTEFRREDAVKSRFPFSHLYTALGYDGFSNYLDVKAETEDASDFVPKSKARELEDIFLWLYGSKKSKIEPVVKSQNPDLRNLNSVLLSKEATARLKKTGNLDLALEVTRPASSIFEEELFSAKASLIKAKGFVTQGYAGSDELLRLAGTIAELADTLYDEMEKVRKTDEQKPKKNRLTQRD